MSASKNDITNDSLTSRVNTQQYRDNYDRIFGNRKINNSVVFDDIMGCDLQKLYFEHRDSAESFVQAIPKISDK